MSPATDTALTIAGFAVSAPFVLFFGLPFGVFTAGVAVDQQQPRPGRRDTLQRAVALAVPTCLLFGIYIAALALAWTASGPTFYYPLVAVPLGFAAWYATLVGLTDWVQHTRMAGPFVENPQAALRRAFASETIDDSERAVNVVIEHLREARIAYPTTGLVAERFGTGWVVYHPATASGTPAGRGVFLVGRDGRVVQRASPPPP
ncbi:MAG: hypothetical protein CK429_09980 [Mycobacterium sp.]|nr:hypothetical protein [Mycobacterium gordonae]PJE15964.1 MAG: hypothetical protein CK429_09980 [Mycobacterium sp.]